MSDDKATDESELLKITMRTLGYTTADTGGSDNWSINTLIERCMDIANQWLALKNTTSESPPSVPKDESELLKSVNVLRRDLESACMNAEGLATELGYYHVAVGRVLDFVDNQLALKNTSDVSTRESLIKQIVSDHDGKYSENTVREILFSAERYVLASAEEQKCFQAKPMINGEMSKCPGEDCGNHESKYRETDSAGAPIYECSSCGMMWKPASEEWSYYTFPEDGTYLKNGTLKIIGKKGAMIPLRPGDFIKPDSI
jgi:DNA-directed RNA polymerase subunit M/transcription elongation factor TFIIS